MVHGIRAQEGRRLTVSRSTATRTARRRLGDVVAAYPHIRFIACDGPGHGDSDRLPGHRGADAARDAAEPVGALGARPLRRCPARPGPHPLACTALLPSARDLSWCDGMAEIHIEERSPPHRTTS